MEELEAKQRSLGVAFESLTSQASSYLQFTVEWKELEERLESERREVRTRFEELENRTKEVAELEAKAARLTAEVEEGTSYLESVKSLIKENDEELKIREEKYDRVVKLINENDKLIREVEEIDKHVKERSRKLCWVEKRIEVKNREVEKKERELREVTDVEDGVRKMIELRKKELEDCESELKGKEERLRLVEGLIANCDKVKDLEEKKLEGVKELLEKSWEEIDLKEDEIEGVKWGIEDCNKKLKGKEERLKLIEEEIVKCERMLESKERLVEDKEREVREVKDVLAGYCKERELEEKKLDEIKELIDERRKELYLKGDEMVVVQRKIEECDKVLKGKEARLRSVEESIADCCKRLESKEGMIAVVNLKAKEFCLLKKSMEEWGCKLEMKERELEGWVGKLELKEKEVEAKVEELDVLRSKFLEEVQSREKHMDSLGNSLVIWEKDLHSLQKKVEECSRGSEIIRDGIGLQQFMDNHLKRIDSMGTDLSAILKDSSDPGKLVLDAMQGFYPDNGESDFELGVRRRSCCLLLQELRRISPQMNPPMKEEATKLAAIWKAKMKVASDNDLEVMGFLWLVAAYDLTSVYDEKELKRLLSNVSHGQQAAQIGLVLGITEPGNRIISPIKIEEPEYSMVNSAATISSPNAQLGATTEARDSHATPRNAATISSPNPQSGATTDATDSQGFTIHNEIVASVQSAKEPEKHVLKIMERSLVKYWTSADASMKKRVMSCNISLLKVLIRLSPQVELHVKEDANKLGLQWKAKIRAGSEHLEHALEIAGFLLFVVAYGLLPTLNGDEIVEFLEKLSQHKEAVESCQMHDFLDKILAVFIQTLVERKQLFQALGFVFKFKLLDNFTPVRVLQDYVKDVINCLSETLKKKNSVDEKVEFLDSQIAGLRTVLRCIKEYSLESEYPSSEIAVEISGVEKLKEICRGPEKCLVSVTTQNEHSQGKKRSLSTSSPAIQQGQQQKSKFQRTAEAAPSSYISPSFRITPVHLQSRPASPLAYGTYGQRGQVHDMATNSSQVDRYSSLVSQVHGQRGQFAHVAANLAEVNPRFGAIDEVDPHFGVHNLPSPYPFTGFMPFPGRYGPY